MAATASYALTVSDDDVREVFQHLMAGSPFGFDIETGYHGDSREGAALHPEENFVAGFSVAGDLTWGRYIPIAHDCGPNADETLAAFLLWEALATGNGVAHGAKFELRCLSRWFMAVLSEHPFCGAAVREANGYFRVRSCTLLESHAEGRNFSHGLKEVTDATFKHKMVTLAELFESVSGKPLTKHQERCVRFSDLDPENPKVVSYACEDSVWALANHRHRFSALLAGPQKDIYLAEMAVLPVVCAMEDEGVQYDWLYMRDGLRRAKDFRDRLAVELNDDLTALVRGVKGEDAPPVRINLGSPQQIARVLYEDIGLPQRRVSRKTGKQSTDKLALKPLAAQYPAVKKILNWKSLTKLIGTYLEKYEYAYGYAHDGRTHPSHLQHGVPAGRFAVADPPYQQTPKQYHYVLNDGTAFDFNFRDSIVAPDGWYLLGYDYSQIELRVIAGEAQEQALLDAFERGDDVHSLTASLMLGKPLEAVTPDDRALGKTLNFALVYQMSVDGLADRLGISHDAADDLFTQYFAAYPRIKFWTDSIVAAAKTAGYVGTRFGRRVPIWAFTKGDVPTWEYREGERLAGNAPVQGGAADYMKWAMIRVSQVLTRAGLADRVRLVMNIHDALEFYVRRDLDPRDVIKVLEPAVIFPVQGWPAMVAEWHAGLRWGSVRELEWDGENVRLKQKKEAPLPLYDPADIEEPLVDIRQVTLPNSFEGGQTVREFPEQQASQLPGAHHETQARTVIVTVTQMPDMEGFHRFQNLLVAAYGHHRVILSTPDGDVPMPPSGIGPAYQQAISLALGQEALVSYDLDAADYKALASGSL